jgi:acyl carrier protein
MLNININNEAADAKYFPLRKISDSDSIAIIVRDVLSEKSGIDFNSIQDTASFADDLNIDSLDFIEIIMELENKFKIKINDEESEKFKNVANITQFIKQKISPK